MRGFLLGLSVFFLCVFGVWGGARIVNGIQFEQEIGGYLKRAADANTIPLAADNLQTALSGIQKRGLTKGYTSLLWRTPDEDVGFWHTNLTSALHELNSTEKNATQLEKTNVLMKLRETLLDEGEKTHVTVPNGASIYPKNTGYAWWGWGAFLLFSIFGISAFALYANDDF